MTIFGRGAVSFTNLGIDQQCTWYMQRVLCRVLCSRRYWKLAALSAPENLSK